MSGWVALDVAIGLVLTYVVASLLCSTVNELIASALGLRAKYLQRWLANLLADPAQLEAFYGHPLVGTALRQPRHWWANKTKVRKPSYVSTDTFATVVLGGVGGAQLEAVLAALAEQSGGDPAELRRRLERWYDDAMGRVSGWYKRRVQFMLWLIGALVVVTLNVDTLHIARTLWTDPAVRAAVVAEAGRATEAGSPPANLTATADEVRRLQALNVPLGWSFEEDDPRGLPGEPLGVLAKILGLLATMLAIMLGAPFWFDLLSKIARLRSSGAPPPASGAVRGGEGDQPRAGPGAVSP